MKLILRPTSEHDDWKQFLAEPEKTLGGGRFGGVAGAISTWARRLATGSSTAAEASGGLRDRLDAEAAALRERWPDAAATQ